MGRGEDGSSEHGEEMRVTGRGVASTAARLRKLECDERLFGSARDEIEAGDVLSDGRESEECEQFERFEGGEVGVPKSSLRQPAREVRPEAGTTVFNALRAYV